MRKVILFLTLITCFNFCFGQVTWPGISPGNPKTVADTTVFYSARIDGRGNEIVIRNRTKDTLGLLTNIGQGLTKFIKSRQINDSQIVIGLDTLPFRGGKGDSAKFGTLPFLVSLDTFHWKGVINKEAVSVKEAKKGGVFNLLPKAGRTADSGITRTVIDDTSQLAERDRSQSESINFAWYGTADYSTTTGTGTDNKPAFLRALKAAISLGPNGSINIPAGNWYFDDSIGIKQNIRIHGVRGTTIWVRSGKTWLVFWDADGPPGTTSSATAINSEVDHLTINQKLPYTTGFGLKASCTVNFHDLTFNDFANYAIYINAGAISSTLWGLVRNVMITDRGDTTSVAPTVTFGGQGSGVSGTAIIGHGLKSCIITDSGRDYYSSPSIKVGLFGSLITEDNIDQAGFGAFAVPIMGLDTVYMLTQGSGYSTATMTITGSSAADNPTAVPIISGGKIIGATVTHRGKGFSQNSDIHIAISGNGTGAVAFGTMLVVGATITQQGGLFESNATLFFTGGRHGTGHDAEGTGVIFPYGKVKRVELISRGTGNGPLTTITFSNNTKGQVITFGDGIGNANRCQVVNINASRCLGAVWTEGGDVNAGYFEKINAITCRGYGVQERSFLGNTWNSCHTELNLGSYLSTSNTGVQTLFENCYGEGGQLPRVGIAPAKLYGGDRGDLIAGSWLQPLQTFTGNLPENGTVEFTQLGPNSNQTIGIGGPTDDGTFLSAENSSGGAGNKLRLSMTPVAGNLIINFSPANVNADIGLVIFGRWNQHLFGHLTPQQFVTWPRFLKVGEQGEDVDSSRGISNNNHQPNVNDDAEFAKGDFVINRNPNAVNKVFGWIRLTQSNVDHSNNATNVDWLPLVSANGFTDTHIGNTDLDFTGNRIIHVKNFNLTWDSTLDFKIVRQAASGTRESLQRWYMSDGGTNHVFVGNLNPTDGVYSTSVGSFFESGTGAFTIPSLTTAAKDSSSGNAMFKIRAARTTSNTAPLNGTITNIVNRDIFQVLNGFGTSELFNIGPLGQIRMPRFNNNSAEDSVLSTDVNGNLKMKLMTSGSSGGSGLTSIGLNMPPAFIVGAPNPRTTNGSITVTGAGTNLQYIDGTGNLRTFPTTGGLESDPLSIHNQSASLQTANFLINGTGNMHNVIINQGGLFSMINSGNHQVNVDANNLTSNHSASWPDTDGDILLGLRAGVSVTFPSTANGANSSVTATVTNAVDGDAVEVGSSNSITPAGCFYKARGSGANQITITFFNFSGSTQTPSGALNIRVIK